MKILIASGVAAILLAAPALAQRETREVPVSEFDRLEAGGNFSLVFDASASAALRMEGDPDDMDDIEIDIRRGELEIRQHRGGFRRWFGGYRNLDVTVYVSGTQVTSFDLSRGVNAGLSSVDGDDLSINVSTGANARFEGVCGHVSVNVSTGADLNARDLECQSVRINASTGSDATVHAIESLVANVSTGADVRSPTDPAHLRLNTSTGGDVHVNRDRRARRDGRHQGRDQRDDDRQDSRHEDRDILKDG
ncbi:GIN domain-containing protein [Hyphobacterium sp.]|uniref:GIN domain-containing protein n=1 Tax=Hyphobacterium sp. TaxID=2004662 RepID=UPI003BABB8CE